MSTDLIDETREAMATLKTYDGPETVVQFEPSEDRIVIDREGKKHAGKTEPFIKLGLGFLKVAAEMKGPQISVFIVICLHVNENGKSWPGIRKICKETGYGSEAVVKAIRELRDAGFIRVVPRKNNMTTVYEPVLAAFGRSNPKAFRSPKHIKGVSVAETGCFGSRNAGVSVAETKQEPMNKNQEPESADAQSLAPSGGADSKKARRDALDIQASFEAYKAKGRAAGADQTAAAHPMAGRWPHLVAHCRAFEDASGMDARSLTPSALKAWAGQLEDHLRAAVTADDEKTLVNMARSKRWDVLQPKSVTSLIGAMRAKPAAAAAEQAAQPLY